MVIRAKNRRIPLASPVSRTTECVMDVFNVKRRHPSRLAVIVAALLVASCSQRPSINPEGPYWKDDDCKPIPEPAFREPGLLWTSIDRSLFDQTLELLDMDRNVRKVTGKMDEAMNANSFDEVTNSSWFNNRMGLPQTRLTPEEITAGVNTIGGPDTTGPWLVFRPKVGGVTPGFWIQDVKGNRYIIKFDPKGHPDLSTGATAMAGRFFHACGYNVAEEYIVYWRPDMLQVKEGATIEDPDGTVRPLSMEDIKGILAAIEQEPDGRIRSLASLLLGNVKGPYSLTGTRQDDPNDWCPHERRRELRGLYVMASFANHFDVKDQNSMDVYVGEPGQGYLKHYLMDFGSTFGSAGHGPMQPRMGYANLMDLRDMGVSMLTLGLKKWQWEDAPAPVNPSVGYYEADIFHPAKWDPVYPIPPFENMTARDGYWGAKIVMAFRDEHLRALLKAGHYRDPQAEEYLFQTMKRRRDKIGRYWFDKVNPLDYPEVRVDGEDVVVSFHDLAVLYELVSTPATYRYELLHEGRVVAGPEDMAVPVVRVSLEDLDALPSVGGGNDRESRLIEVTIRTSRDGGGRWSDPAVFWLLCDTDSRTFRIVAIEHPG